MVGIVKWFNGVKGYGFILDDETGIEYFVHQSNTLDFIQEKDKVTFDLIKTDRGTAASNVALVNND